MTDKQIIIDGVDVSECTFFDKSSGHDICCCRDTRKNQGCLPNFCAKNKKCQYKKLNFFDYFFNNVFINVFLSKLAFFLIAIFTVFMFPK